jgi:hypothetical protein
MLFLPVDLERPLLSLSEKAGHSAHCRPGASYFESRETMDVFSLHHQCLIRWTRWINALDDDHSRAGEANSPTLGKAGERNRL